MDLAAIMTDLRHRVEIGELDADVVNKLAERAEDYYRLALGDWANL